MDSYTRRAEFVFESERRSPQSEFQTVHKGEASKASELLLSAPTEGHLNPRDP